MRILITGGTGFIGSHLVPFLLEQGHAVTVQSRDPQRARRQYHDKVDAVASIFDVAAGCEPEAVINLAGENLTEGRWSHRRKQAMRDSRIGTTAELNRFFATHAQRPRIFISGSAIGYYGSDDTRDFVEADSAGDDFAAILCRDWEREARQAASFGIRVCLLRTGLVLGRGGGMLEKLLPVFRLGLGGPLGNGRQWMSWVHIDDLIGIIDLCLRDDRLEGPVNGTAPEPVDNNTFTRTLARTLHRPAFFRVPAFMLRLMLGEMADLLLSGQKVLPQKAQQHAYSFRFPHLDAALADLLDASAPTHRESIS